MTWGDILFWPLSYRLFYLFLTILLISFSIWMIVDSFKRKFRIEAERWIWIVLILITKGIGALIYYIVVKEYNPRGIAKK